MNKKCLIVTFQNAFNYGAMLQCYALQHTLERNGVDVKVLNYENKVINDFYKIFYYPKNEKFLKKYLKSSISALYFFRQLYGRNKKFKKFLENNSNLKPKTGNIVTTKGEVLGKHTGLYNYTIGQRKGLGISYHSP